MMFYNVYNISIYIHDTLTGGLLRMDQMDQKIYCRCVIYIYIYICIILVGYIYVDPQGYADCIDKDI